MSATQPRSRSAGEAAPASGSAGAPSSGALGTFDESELRGLVTRAQQGDLEAFGMLYRHHYPEVLRYLARRLGDREVAEDLAQQVFLKAWQAIPRYRDQGRPLLAWLYTIARHQVVDHARSQRPVQRLSDEVVGEPSRAEEQVLAAERQREVREALERLPEDYREVLILRFWLEKPATEVGELMGRSAGAVRVLQLRAVRALRAELEGHGVAS